MAVRKTTEASEQNSTEALKENMIALANEIIEQVRGKQVDGAEYITKVVDIYNAVK